MGVVYKARQKSLDRLVALKLLAPEREKDAAFAGRFEKEAQALARLNHPNITTVYDFGESDGLYYLLMELVDGVNLRQAMAADAEVVAFDPESDLAVLRTDGSAPALALRTGRVGDTGGVFGYPGGGPLEISPFRVAEEINAVGRDIFDRGTTTRDVLVLAAELAPGDSGSALVDADGQVVGVAFAVAPDRSGVSYALAVDEVRPLLEGDLGRARDTGSCLV